MPWPPPPSTVRGIVQLDLLGTEKDTLGTLHKNLTDALAEADYKNISTYRVANGFAVITKLERITRDLEPYPDEEGRWVEGEVPPLNLKEYLRSLVLGTEGKFRTIIFIITPLGNFADDGRPMLTPSSAKYFYRKGGLTLPDDIASQAVKGTYIHCLVYQFEKKNGGQANFVYDSPDNLEKHLSQSGIFH